MVVTIVQVQVKPGFEDAFKEASLENHEASVSEAGNRRFDVLQSTADPCSFVLYEAYDSVEQAALHKQTAHYLAWRDAVASMMAEPRKGIPFISANP